MNAIKRALASALLVVMLAVSARSQEPPPSAEPEVRVQAEPEAQPTRIPRSHDPRLALTAAFLNIGYVPLRLAVVAVGAVLGGFTGFITFGDLAAAQAVWGLTNGPMVITPEMLDGTEHWQFSDYD